MAFYPDLPVEMDTDAWALSSQLLAEKENGNGKYVLEMDEMMKEKQNATPSTSMWSRPLFAMLALLAWIFVLCVIYAIIGFYESAFFRLGPGPEVTIFGITVDNW